MLRLFATLSITKDPIGKKFYVINLMGYPSKLNNGSKISSQKV